MLGCRDGQQTSIWAAPLTACSVMGRPDSPVRAGTGRSRCDTTRDDAIGRCPCTTVYRMALAKPACQRRKIAPQATCRLPILRRQVNCSQRGRWGARIGPPPAKRATAPIDTAQAAPDRLTVALMLRQRGGARLRGGCGLRRRPNLDSSRRFASGTGRLGLERRFRGRSRLGLDRLLCRHGRMPRFDRSRDC